MIPFSFVLDYLPEAVVRPMFGCHALYVRNTLVLIVRKRATHRSANGIWIATKRDHHASLRKLFPSMRSIGVLGKGVTNWQMIPERAKDFEESALRLCELVTKGDPRIGSVRKRA